jgi:hypothetical protein
MVDFNAADRDGVITASIRYAALWPEVGSFITLYDPEANECDAVVAAVDHERGTFRCRIDWEAWRSEPPMFRSSQPLTQFAGAAAA